MAEGFENYRVILSISTGMIDVALVAWQ